MADGSNQYEFNLPRKNLVSALRKGEIVIDFFAGGGGASEALKQALGRDPDVAVNHDPDALGMHAANHPFTRHLPADVWTVDILREVAGRSVGWFHASPDCTHFSQAKGGQPRSKATRSLSWVVLKVAGTLASAGLAPRIISLENVEQILKWGPLVAKRDKATGRVFKLDGTVAEKGERVPVWQQSLVPDKRHQGRTWDQFVAALRAKGYAVEWRKLVASDYGAGTSRKRLFLVARNDVFTIPWPEPTHGKGSGLKPLVTAADCIDFSVPCPSIFTRKKPLADATMRRIARGVKRYVLDAAEPFIVGVGGRMGQTSERSVHEPSPTTTSKYDAALIVPTLAPFITEHANASRQPNYSAAEPMRTQCAEVKGGHFALAAPVLVQTGYGERAGQAPRSLDLSAPLGVTPAGGIKHAVAAAHLIKFRGDSKGAPADDPMPTITSGAGSARPAGAAHAMGVITAFLEQANTGVVGHDAREPVSTIVGRASTQRIVTGHLTAFGQNAKGSSVDEPLQTALGGATRFGVVECELAPEHEAGALRVAAFLIKYYGKDMGVAVDEPMDTITTKDKLALVTVWIGGHPYVIIDIGLRMLRREELFRAQGFPADYIIDRTADGRKLSISRSVRMVGNSVSPPPLAAIARANLDQIEQEERIAA